jgi:DNA-binding NarL/FixJ family response regulator
MVDVQGQVRFANRSARATLGGASGGLVIRNERLGADAPADQRALLKALRGACEGLRSLVCCGVGEQRRALAVVPLAQAGEAPMALVLLGRDQRSPSLSLDFFAREHHITPAEVAVLRLLCDGRRPSDIAPALGVAVSTVRTQVCSLRQKTGTRRTADLVRIVTALPPILALLN